MVYTCPNCGAKYEYRKTLKNHVPTCGMDLTRHVNDTKSRENGVKTA